MKIRTIYVANLRYCYWNKMLLLTIWFLHICSDTGTCVSKLLSSETKQQRVKNSFLESQALQDHQTQRCSLHTLVTSPWTLALAVRAKREHGLRNSLGKELDVKWARRNESSGFGRLWRDIIILTGASTWVVKNVDVNHKMTGEYSIR